MAVQKKTYTLAEYEQLQDLPENRGKLLELIDGEIVEKVASFTPSRIAARIIQLIGNYLDEHNIGEVTAPDGTYVMSDDNGFIPDVGYITHTRLPEEPTRFASVPPDMAVEVKSPTDSKRELRMKAEKYLTLGTQLVWLVFPDEQIVEVYVPGRDVEEFSANDILDGGNVLPGFEVHIRRIFTR